MSHVAVGVELTMAGAARPANDAPAPLRHRRSLTEALRRPASSDPLRTPGFVPDTEGTRVTSPARGASLVQQPLALGLKPGLLPPLRPKGSGSLRSYGSTGSLVLASAAASTAPASASAAVAGAAAASAEADVPVAAPRSLWWSLMVLYGCYGAAWGGWGARLPEFKDDIEASDLAFAGLLVCNIGAYLAMQQLHNALEKRLILPPTLPVSSVAFPLALALVPRVATLQKSALVMAVTGVLSELFNHDLTHVTTVLRHDGAEHAEELTRASFAAGELLGSSIGLIVTVRGINVRRHMLQTGALLAALGGVASLWGPRALPDLDHGGEAALPFVSRSQRLLNAVGILMAIGHTAIANWLGIYLRDNLGASASWATAGYVVFAAGAFVGELYSSHLIGPPHLDPRVLMFASVSVPLALWLSLGMNGTYSVLVGAATAGAGLGVFRPVASQAAGRLAATRQAPPPVLGVLSGLQNAGFLFGNILIGVAAQRLDLRAGLALAGSAGVAKLALSERLRQLMHSLEEDVAAWRGESVA